MRLEQLDKMLALKIVESELKFVIGNDCTLKSLKRQNQSKFTNAFVQIFFVK